MPTHKSAAKRMRTSRMARQRNRALKSAMKTAIKKVHQAGDKQSAEQALRVATSLLDRLAQKGVIHRNTAARRKSKLTGLVNSMEAETLERLT